MFASVRQLFTQPAAEGYAPIAAEDGQPERRVATDTRARDGRDVYLCFWALGAGILLTWNALICTFPLLTSFFEGPIKTTLPSYIGTVYCFANLFFLGLAQRNVGKKAPTGRLRWSLLLMLATTVMITFPLLPLIFPSLSAAKSPLLLPLILGMTLLLALSCSYLQSAVFGLAALWGSKEMLAVMSGQGGIAVLVSGTQLVLAIVDAGRTPTPDSSASSLAAEGLWALGAAGVVICLAALKHLTEHPDYAAVLAPLVQREEVSGKRGVTRKVFRRNIRVEFAVAFVFVVTLAIFPPITTTITSVREPVPWLLQPTVFVATHFLVFNVGDYVGRTYITAIPGAMGLRIESTVLLSLSRVVFFPLFLLCNTTARAKAGTTVIGDVLYFLILLAFGLTNGGISTICMIYASSPALNKAICEDEKDIAGTLAAFSLVSGLAMGSLCSFGVNYLINGSIFG